MRQGFIEPTEEGKQILADATGVWRTMAEVKRAGRLRGGPGRNDNELFLAAVERREGLDLELVDARGEVVASTRSDFDGFFLFERVPYGSYRIRVAKASAEAAHVPVAINATATVTPEVSVVRMGQIEVAALPQIASAD